MNCKGCGQHKKLVKSHIIPESFFVGLRAHDGKSPLKITDQRNVFPKKAPVGEYDSKILCRECEDIFNAFDNYGSRFLLHERKDFKKLNYGENINVYSVESFDYTLLKLFFISVLWRASISSREFYSNVELGPFQDRAKELIWHQDPGEQDEFSCVLSTLEGHDAADSILPPYRERWDGINFYRFYLFGCVLSIKVDKRPAGGFMRELSIRPESPIHLVARDIRDSDEMRVLKQVARNMNR